MRIAVVHDWLYTFGGAERVLRSILRCLPDADLFTLFDVLSDEDRGRIGFTRADSSFLQRMPGIARRHRLYLPLMPLAIEQLDLSAYDIVISSSYAVAKGVLTGPDQLHLSYVHSPMRYAWDLQHQYLAETRLTRGVRGVLARVLLHRMRIWDTRTSHGVDAYMVNSHFIGRRVRKIYGRSSTVIYPPVDAHASLRPLAHDREKFFLTAGRLVPYKNVRAIVEAFRLLPEQRLMVAGTGPELARLRENAPANVTFAGFMADADLRTAMRNARAFIFAAEEDFGITPLEAQSEGTPVIALGRGGVRETIVTEGASPTGLFFDRPAPQDIADAVTSFLDHPERFSREACLKNAQRFAEARFEAEFSLFVADQIAGFETRRSEGCHVPSCVPVLQAAS